MPSPLVDRPAPDAIIVTAGDVSIDWLWFDLGPEDDKARRKEWNDRTGRASRRWTYRPQVISVAVHGGAWYLDTIARMLAGWRHEEMVFGYERFDEDELRRKSPDTFVHSDTGYTNHEYEPGSLAPTEKTPRGVYRVKNGPTFSGPIDLAKEARPEIAALPDALFQPYLRKCAAERDNPPPNPPSVLPVAAYPAERRTVLLLHDEGNGFAQERARWEAHVSPPAGRPGPKVAAVVLNLTSRESLLGIMPPGPVRDGAPENVLWAALVAGHADRLVVVIHADDLREVGAPVSRSLSWERTAQDLVTAFASHPVLKELARARHVVVRFGVSGALHVSRDFGRATPRFVLHYDPAHLEGEYRVPAQQGEMIGYNSVLAATLATEIRAGLDATGGAADWSVSGLDDRCAVGNGVANCRVFFRYGFGPAARDHLARVTAWDQIGNRRRPRTYPPQLTSVGKILYQPVDNDRSFVAFAVSHAERTNAASNFALDGEPDYRKTQRERGGTLLDHDGLIAEVKARMTAVVARWWEASWAEVRAEWLRKHPADTVPAGAPLLAWPDASSARVALGRLALHPTVSVKRPAGLKTTIEQRMREALRPWSRRLLAKAVKAGRGQPSWFHTARQFVSEVDDCVYQDIDWDYGWPVCVRAFAADAARFARVEIPGADPSWQILGGDKDTLLEIATEIILEGAKDALARPRPTAAGGDGRFPVAVFGLLRTADRWEGESYRSIRNLIREYLGKPKPERPLSIAVFGPPGGGKSFGVKQIAQSLDKDRVVPDEYNLSQFTSPADLSRAFIRMRDKAVGGKVPLVFFDEFDAQIGDQKLAWLKYFLSVMQDGTHRFDGQDLRVGQAILVFAGGTSKTYREFAAGVQTDAEREQFKLAKGPDFVSRLRGYVDIIGPNPHGTNADVHSDAGCLVRRALTLDHQLRLHHPALVGADKKLRIDRDVLRALLTVPVYTHGSRSVEAVVETSALAGADRFDKSALLPEEQLGMHLDWGAVGWDHILAGKR
jgi:hypothetical protein